MPSNWSITLSVYKINRVVQRQPSLLASQPYKNSLLYALSQEGSVMPNTKAKLAILEPITFPKAKSDEPFKAAFILTISSGAEVANETTVIQ